MLTILALTAASFAATNVDNLLLLVSWLLGRVASTGKVFAGYMIGVTSLLVISLLLGQLAQFIPVAMLGYLGVIPVALGVKMLMDNVRESGNDAEPEATGGSAVIATIAVTQVANGIDTVLVFAPLLLDSSREFDIGIALAFLVCAVLWFLLARVLTLHASRLRWVVAAGAWLAPVVMIVVGLYILDNTATDLVSGIF